MGSRAVCLPAAGPSGWRGRISVFLDSVRLAAALFRRPLRHRIALGGMLTFWAAEMFAIWTGLAAFGFIMDEAALICGFCTGWCSPGALCRSRGRES